MVLERERERERGMRERDMLGMCMEKRHFDEKRGMGRYRMR